MNTETLDKLKALRTFVQAVSSWWANYRKTISDSRCDKYGAGFNNDHRFMVFGEQKIYFSAHTGYYGSSSCSSFGHLDSTLAAFYLPRALTALAPEIFTKMAELAAKDAAKIGAEAEKELEQLRELVAAATGEKDHDHETN